jgi:hypothetical protein
VIFLHRGEREIRIKKGRPNAEPGDETGSENPVRFLFQDQFTQSASPFPWIPGIPWFTPSRQVEMRPTVAATSKGAGVTAATSANLSISVTHE